MRRVLKWMATVTLAGFLAVQCGAGSAGGGSFKWYGSNPPVPNNTCEYLGKTAAGTEVWQCTPL